MSERRAGERGFTLLEVMVAMAILAGVVVTVLASLNYHLGVATDDSSIVIASMLGREKAEEVMLTGIPTIRKGNFEGDFSNFSWALSTEDVKLASLKRLSITVSWEGGRHVDFISYVQVR